MAWCGLWDVERPGVHSVMRGDLTRSQAASSELADLESLGLGTLSRGK